MNRAKTRQPLRYRIGRRHRRWMLIAPSGNSFISLGVVHLGAVPGFHAGPVERRIPLTENCCAPARMDQYRGLSPSARTSRIACRSSRIPISPGFHNSFRSRAIRRSSAGLAAPPAERFIKSARNLFSTVTGEVTIHPIFNEACTFVRMLQLVRRRLGSPAVARQKP